MAEKIIRNIIATIDQAITEFQDRVPGIQKLVFTDLQALIKKLATKEDKILATVQNLKLIGEIKNRIGQIMIDRDYVNSVKKFTSAFNVVEALQNGYFSAFSAKYKPKQTLGVLKELAVDATLNSLMGAGMNANVIDKVGEILRMNITGGGSYGDLSDQVREFILTNESGLGVLERYTTQITTDALNQYSAQYQQAVSADLGFNWGRYIGSNIKTTREFCLYLTKKEWIHRSELKEILSGNIDGHHCKLGKNGLPLGMIAGTNEANFQIYRGGYNCGHQIFFVPDSSVPKEIANRFKQSY